MRIMYCWRCGRDVPMLDEGEFPEIERAYRESMRASFAKRELQDAKEKAVTTAQAVYERLTHTTGVDKWDVLQHRISLYGPPCRACGKPLRTPQARLCAACWTRVSGA